MVGIWQNSSKYTVYDSCLWLMVSEYINISTFRFKFSTEKDVGGLTCIKPYISTRLFLVFIEYMINSNVWYKRKQTSGICDLSEVVSEEIDSFWVSMFFIGSLIPWFFLNRLISPINLEQHWIGCKMSKKINFVRCWVIWGFHIHLFKTLQSSTISIENVVTLSKYKFHKPQVSQCIYKCD